MSPDFVPLRRIPKFETVVPAAFATAARIANGQGGAGSPERQVRIACRDMFRRSGCWSGSSR